MGWFQYWRVNSKCPSWLSKSKFMMKSSSSTNCSIIRSSMFTRILKEREKTKVNISNTSAFLFFSYFLSSSDNKHNYWNTVNGRNALITKSLEFNVPFSLRDTDQIGAVLMGEWLKRKNLQPNPSSKRQLFNVFKGIIKIQLTFQWIKLHFVLFTMTVLYKHTCMQVLQTRVKRNLWGTI